MWANAVKVSAWSLTEASITHTNLWKDREGERDDIITGPQPRYPRDEFPQSSSSRQGELIKSSHKSSRQNVIELNWMKNINGNFLKCWPAVSLFLDFLFYHGLCFGFIAFISHGGHFRIFLYLCWELTKWWIGGIQRHEPPRRYEHVVTIQSVSVSMCVCVSQIGIWACAAAGCSIMRSRCVNGVILIRNWTG